MAGVNSSKNRNHNKLVLIFIPQGWHIPPQSTPVSSPLCNPSQQLTKITKRYAN